MAEFIKDGDKFYQKVEICVDTRIAELNAAKETLLQQIANIDATIAEFTAVKEA